MKCHRNGNSSSFIINIEIQYSQENYIKNCRWICAIDIIMDYNKHGDINGTCYKYMI